MHHFDSGCTGAQCGYKKPSAAQKAGGAPQAKALIKDILRSQVVAFLFMSALQITANRSMAKTPWHSANVAYFISLIALGCFTHAVRLQCAAFHSSSVSSPNHETDTRPRRRHVYVRASFWRASRIQKGIRWTPMMDFISSGTSSNLALSQNASRNMIASWKACIDLRDRKRL